MSEPEQDLPPPDLPLPTAWPCLARPRADEPPQGESRLFRRIERGLAKAARRHGEACVSERLFSDPDLAAETRLRRLDRLLHKVHYTGAIVRVDSAGVITPTEGEPVAYVIAAPLFGLLCDRAYRGA